MKMIVGFCGLKRSGKDTAARGLLRSSSWVRESFARPIRAMASELAGISLEELDDLKEVKQDFLGGMTLRHLMQNMGTEWGRDMIRPNLWVDALRHRIKDENRVVITDVRFNNEALMLKELGGLLIEIRRPGIEDTDAHRSENSLDRIHIDITIVNDKTPKRLQELTIFLVNKEIQFRRTGRE